jgi:hypothetical protein
MCEGAGGGALATGAAVAGAGRGAGATSFGVVVATGGATIFRVVVGGAVVVGSAVLVGDNGWRYDAFSTRVWGAGSAGAVATSFEGEVVGPETVRIRSAKATGIVHAVEKRVNVWTRTRPRGVTVWCREPCNVARCGVASRRSGATTRARQHPRRTAGRNPPALRFRVLRSPPFLCGLHVNCVGIAMHARRGRARHQFDVPR